MSSDWLCSQKTHTVTETQRERATDRQSERAREIMRERKGERDYNVAANECQGMLYIFSHHASLNTRLRFL